MPDIRIRPADFRCHCEDHLLVLFSDLPSLSGSGNIHYKLVIVIFRRSDQEIEGLITLEQSESMSNAFCIFNESGKHENFGELPDENAFGAFLSGAGILLRDKFGIDTSGDWEPVVPATDLN
jgi:hypothetical protein